MDPYESPPRRRESLLTILLATSVLLAAFVFLVLITGGWIMWLLLVVGALGFLYACHYLLWGKLLDDQVAGEREEEILRQRAADANNDGWSN